MFRKILLGIFLLLLIVQFIRPERNAGDIHGPQSLYTTGAITPAVEQILVRACYDCHSNSTRYPWYANIQPLGWWLHHHVNEGKESLNLSEWTTYKAEDMPHILEELHEEVEEGHMPLPSYLRVHRDAVLSAAEKDTLLHWSKALETSLRDRG